MEVSFPNNPNVMLVEENDNPEPEKDWSPWSTNVGSAYTEATAKIPKIEKDSSLASTIDVVNTLLKTPLGEFVAILSSKIQGETVASMLTISQSVPTLTAPIQARIDFLTNELSGLQKMRFQLGSFLNNEDDEKKRGKLNDEIDNVLQKIDKKQAELKETFNELKDALSGLGAVQMLRPDIWGAMESVWQRIRGWIPDSSVALADVYSSDSIVRVKFADMVATAYKESGQRVAQPNQTYSSGNSSYWVTDSQWRTYANKRQSVADLAFWKAVRRYEEGKLDRVPPRFKGSTTPFGF